MKRDWLIFPLFLLLVFLLRFSSFFQSALGSDESLYLLMARSLTQGNPPYTEIWDHKPIGIYILFSLALTILGNSILSIRIATCIAVTITSYLLYRLGKFIGINNSKVGLLAGILYAVISTESGGASSGFEANTEIFFAPFVVFAFYLLFSNLLTSPKPISQSKQVLFIIGLSMGIGFQIKQVVLFEFIGILILVGLKLYERYKHNLKYLLTEIFQSNSFLCIGFVLPSVLALLYFVVNGHLDDYIYASFSANLVRVSDETLSINYLITGLLIQIKSNLILWLCLLTVPFYWKSSQGTDRTEKRNLVYLIIWLFMAFLGVCSPKSFYVRYFIQMLPPLCLISSYIVIKTISEARDLDKFKKFIIVSLILLTPLLFNIYTNFEISAKSVYFRYLKGVNNWGDNPAIIANYLQERVNQEDYIYVVDYLAIMYYLVPAKIPTKYAFPEFLTIPKLSAVAGVNPVKELHSIMDKKPVYIIKAQGQKSENEKFSSELERYLNNNYVIEKEFTGNLILDTSGQKEIVYLYRLKNENKS